MRCELLMPRGRKPGFVMSDAHRVKIQNSNILSSLIKHVEGSQDMTSTQVTAGIALLKKVLPDMQAVTLSGDEDRPIKTEEVGEATTKLTAYLDSIADKDDE